MNDLSLQLEPSIDELRAEVRAVLGAHPDLHAHGFGHPGDTEGASYDDYLKRERAELLSDHGIDHFYRARVFLEWAERLNCGARKSRGVNSFALKHAAERFWTAHLGGFTPPSGTEESAFVSNGALIAAAIHHGYAIEFIGYNPRILISSMACHLPFYWYRQTFRDFAEAVLNLGADTLTRFKYKSAPYRDVQRAMSTVRRAVRSAPPRPREYTTEDVFARVRGEVREAQREIHHIIERQDYS